MDEGKRDLLEASQVGVRRTLTQLGEVGGLDMSGCTSATLSKKTIVIVSLHLHACNLSWDNHCHSGRTSVLTTQTPTRAASHARDQEASPLTHMYSPLRHPHVLPYTLVTR